MSVRASGCGRKAGIGLEWVTNLAYQSARDLESEAPKRLFQEEGGGEKPTKEKPPMG
jgi:hypothetical protein